MAGFRLRPQKQPRENGIRIIYKCLNTCKMEPMAGIEPATDGLRNRCSTAELHWQQHCA